MTIKILHIEQYGLQQLYFTTPTKKNRNIGLTKFSFKQIIFQRVWVE